MQQRDELLKEWQEEEVDIEKLNTRLKLSKVWLNALLVFILLASTTFVVIRELKALDADKDLGASPFQLMMLASLVLVIVINIPWQLLGILPSKIGPIEFTEMLGTQKEEQATRLVDIKKEIQQLRQRLSELESATENESRHDGTRSKSFRELSRSPRMVQPESDMADDVSQYGGELNIDSSGTPIELTSEVETWLRNHDNWYFNAPRIKALTALEGTDSAVSRASITEIADVLEALLAEGKAKVKLNRKGNTLYKLK